MDTSWIHFCCTTMGTPTEYFLTCSLMHSQLVHAVTLTTFWILRVFYSERFLLCGFFFFMFDGFNSGDVCISNMSVLSLLLFFFPWKKCPSALVKQKEPLLWFFILGGYLIFSTFHLLGISNTITISAFFFPFYSHICGIWKFLG